MGKKKASSGAAPWASRGAARAAKYADKKLAQLTIDISNQKAKVKREECVQADQELLQKLIQDMKDYKEAPHSTALNLIKPHYPIITLNFIIS